MTRKLAKALILFTLLTNHTAFTRDALQNDSLEHRKKFLIGVDFLKLFTTGDLMVGKNTINREELRFKYYPSKLYYFNVIGGYSIKSSEKVENSKVETRGQYFGLGVGTDFGKDKVLQFTLGYNLCLTSYRQKSTFNINDNFWDESYQLPLGSKHNSVVFSELDMGFKINMFSKKDVGFFIEPNFKFRCLPISSQSLTDREFIPGFGNYGSNGSFNVAFNIMTGIQF